MPAIVSHLRESNRLVICAPPGAGKTTRVPSALLDAGLAGAGSLLMLEPRRVAARAAARRIAHQRGVRLGDEVGYRVRFDDRTSKRTRIALLTEGLLTSRLQHDPTLDGVGVVILDEFHERSIHADLALAFLKEIQETVREDLRVVVMSATLDADRVSAFLGGCPIVRSDGRLHPVARHFLTRADDRSLPDRVAAQIRRAMRPDEGDDGGDLLVFLPGAPEIRRVQSTLGASDLDADVHALYGDLDAAKQDAALLPGPRRKIVLATNIAETSLTIEGVTTVVDAGLMKRPRHDPSRGIDRLETVRISGASAEQRAGRAGRLAPGRVFRMWTEHEHRSLAKEDVPEVRRIDLASTLMDVIAWSGKHPKSFDWYEAPSDAAIAGALSLLRTLGAVERGAHRLTELGTTLRRLPLHPRTAAVLVKAHGLGVARGGAALCALTAERDIVRRGDQAWTTDLEAPSDLIVRLDRFETLERRRFGGSADLDIPAARGVARVRDQLLRIAEHRLGPSPAAPDDEDLALRRALLAGFADRVARRRKRGSDRVRMVGGRGGKLAPESVVKQADLLVAVQLDDNRGGPDSTIRWASAIDEAWLEADLGGVCTETVVRFNEQREAAEAVAQRRFEDLVLAERLVTDADPVALAEALAAAAAKDPQRALRVADATETLLWRIDFVRRTVPDAALPDLGSDPMLEVLPELCVGLRSFADLRKADACAAIRSRLGWAATKRLDQLAPERIDLGTGKPWRLRYEADGPPVLSIQLQRLFGVAETPLVAGGRVAVKVELLAPNRRPVQVTQDLASFWRSTYPEVRKQLRARYPKHAWPEHPQATISAK